MAFVEIVDVCFIPVFPHFSLLPFPRQMANFSSARVASLDAGGEGSGTVGAAQVSVGEGGAICQ